MYIHCVFQNGNVYKASQRSSHDCKHSKEGQRTTVFCTIEEIYSLISLVGLPCLEVGGAGVRGGLLTERGQALSSDMELSILREEALTLSYRACICRSKDRTMNNNIYKNINGCGTF